MCGEIADSVLLSVFMDSGELVWQCLEYIDEEQKVPNWSKVQQNSYKYFLSILSISSHWFCVHILNYTSSLFFNMQILQCQRKIHKLAKLWLTLIWAFKWAYNTKELGRVECSKDLSFIHYSSKMFLKQSNISFFVNVSYNGLIGA